MSPCLERIEKKLLFNSELRIQLLVRIQQLINEENNSMLDLQSSTICVLVVSILNDPTSMRVYFQGRSMIDLSKDVRVARL